MLERKRLIHAVVILLCLAYFAGLLYYAAVRSIDQDEGFYATAARLVWEGKAPYRDFFYQQAPLLPYLYGWIWAIHPRSLLSMRFLSAAFGGLTVLLWGLCLLSAKRLPTKVALAVLAAVLLNPYWVSWNVVVKTFAVANLLMSMAAICLYAALHSERARWYFFAGLALGLCASVRSLYGPLIPFVLVWLLYGEWKTSKPPYPKTLTLLAGATLGLLPIIVSFVADPHAFIFNNIQYHGLQAGWRWQGSKFVTGYGSIGQTVLIYFAALVIRLMVFHPYFTAELVLATVGGLSLLKLHKTGQGPYTNQDYLYIQLAFLMLVVYTATALIPFPPYDQYFDSPLLPFLIPFMAEGLRVAFSRGRSWVVLLTAAALIFSLGEITREAGENSAEPFWQLPSYRQVTKLIEANSSPDDCVLSLWPGWVFESGRRYFPGLEDQFVFRIMNVISPEARARYHVVSRDDVVRVVSTRAAHLLVLARWSEYFNGMSPGEVEAFYTTVQANYALVSKIDDVEIYRRLPATNIARVLR